MKKPAPMDASDWNNGGGSGSKKDRFRRLFLRSLRQSLRHGFSIEECFGVVWTETLDEIALSDSQEFELYQELIEWAKRRILSGGDARDWVDVPGDHWDAGEWVPNNYWVRGRVARR